MRARVWKSLRAALCAGCVLFAVASFAQEFQPLPAVESEFVGEPADVPYASQSGGWFSNLEQMRFPPDLLWTPPFASKREPRMSAMATSLDNHADPWTLDTSIGATFGLTRIARPEAGWAFQMDTFAVVQTRLSPEDLIAADYRYGFPLTLRIGPSTMKVSYEHTSAHVGDEGMALGGLKMIHYAKDELVVGVDYWFSDLVRPYGQISYAMWQDFPYDFVSHWRFDVGMEIYDRLNDGIRGVPFFAIHADFRGELEQNGCLNVQLGWLWRTPANPKVRGRAFVEYYVGRSPYGQFMAKPEEFVSGGIAYDY